MPDNKTGSCLCGAVAYAVSSEFEVAGNCHCNICKKITGGAFEAFAVIDAGHFSLLQGEQSLVEYRISRKAKKYFCGVCGTPLYNLHRLAPGKVIVHIGSLDAPTEVRPTFNLHCENRLSWVEEIGDLKNFEQGFS